MKLIPNWKAALGHYSTIALGVVLALPAAWAAFPPELKAFIPPDKLAVVAAAVAGAGFIGKFVKQGRDQ